MDQDRLPLVSTRVALAETNLASEQFRTAGIGPRRLLPRISGAGLPATYDVPEFAPGWPAGPGARGILTIASDGTLHGSICLDASGTVTCDWPEQHGWAYETRVAPEPRSQFRVKELSAIELNTASSIKTRIANVLILMVGIAVFAGGATMYLGGYSMQPVTSGSMRPGIQPGDLAVLQKVPTTSLNVGDVIAYVPPDKTTPLMHRIITLDKRGAVVVQTEGDANHAADAGPVRLDTVSYRLVATVPALGWLIVLRAFIWPALAFLLVIIALGWCREVMRNTQWRRKRPALVGLSIASQEEKTAS